MKVGKHTAFMIDFVSDLLMESYQDISSKWIIQAILLSIFQR
jgi:hypothetical protein